MAEHNNLGKEGERLTEDFLVEKGCEILERNFTYGRLEIDLILRDGPFIVAVEVKSRKGAPRESFIQAVGKAKIRSMVSALEFFMRIRNIDLETRFDLVLVYFNNHEAPTIEHIPRFFVP
jgi:putative endonuclease